MITLPSLDKLMENVIPDKFTCITCIDEGLCAAMVFRRGKWQSRWCQCQCDAGKKYAEHLVYPHWMDYAPVSYTHLRAHET